MIRQFMEQIETANNEGGDDKQNGRSEDYQDEPNVRARRRSARQPVIAKKNQHAGNDDQRDQSDHAVEQNRQQCAGLVAGSLFPEQVGFDDITTGSAGKKLVIEHANEEAPGGTRGAQLDPRDVQADMPADHSAY